MKTDKTEELKEIEKELEGTARRRLDGEAAQSGRIRELHRQLALLEEEEERNDEEIERVSRELAEARRKFNKALE